MQNITVEPPSLLTLATYHPQVALAVAMGIPLRPNIRPLSIELQNSQQGQAQRTSFSEVMSQYSIFAGVHVTVDPTNDEEGNAVKYLNDAAQALVTGVTCNLLVKGAGGVDYSPIPDETPVQSVPVLFAPSIYVWRMVNPENVKAEFTLQTQVNASPFTLWLNFVFLVLASEGDTYTNVDPETARRQLMSTTAWAMAIQRAS